MKRGRIRHDSEDVARCSRVLGRAEIVGVVQQSELLDLHGDENQASLWLVFGGQRERLHFSNYDPGVLRGVDGHAVLQKCHFGKRESHDNAGVDG